MMDDLFAYELALRAKGMDLICGIDEAGCGPLAGPVCAAAVILDPERPIAGLNDSKKLTEKKRELLFPQIQERVLGFAVAWATAQEVDELNILQARLLAMRRAVSGLRLRPDIVLVDGNRDPGLDIDTLCIVGGDGKSASIAAASILAKVSRDRVMLELAGEYPQYRFEQHKGYPTKLHKEMIRLHGLCPAHRRTFVHNEG